MKLPVSVPPDRLQANDKARPTGLEDNVQEPPAKLDPITVTTVRAGPEDGESTSVPAPVVAVVVTAPVLMVSASVPVAVRLLLVPVIWRVAMAAGALVATVMERMVGVLPPAGGVTGLELKAPATPVGNPVTAKLTGALKDPSEWTAMLTTADCPWYSVRTLGLTDNENPAVVPVTVNVPLAACPLSPTARTV